MIIVMLYAFWVAMLIGLVGVIGALALGFWVLIQDVPSPACIVLWCLVTAAVTVVAWPWVMILLHALGYAR